ncbi:MAG: VOC family protein [Candidatus Tokpelaia sp.]|nr:MAG: VOC family protein [Candidatus Tokpelaia sp.]KAA6206903.1 MAG: VOC family protein [Candidatus Tokpelaia sp.]
MSRQREVLHIQAIDHIVLNVRDIEQSAIWYEKVLGAKRENYAAQHSNNATGTDNENTVADKKITPAQRISLKFGWQKINLRPIEASATNWFTAQNPQIGSADLCFLVNLPPEEIIQYLKSNNIAIEEGPVTKTGARGAICSVYCRDPDGNLIELSSYPKAVQA